MIVVKFISGCLGNFLCSMLLNLDRNDMPLEFEHKKIPHWGRPPALSDEQWYKNLADGIEELQKQNINIINFNNTVQDNDLDYFYDNNHQMVFIELKDRFIEYRLNHIHKVIPKMFREQDWDQKQKVNLQFLEENSNRLKETWAGYDHAESCDEARRVFRLYEGVEQTNIKKHERDSVLNFGDFYGDKESWRDAFETLGTAMGHDFVNLDQWFDVFQETQKPIIEKAKQIRQSIMAGRFLYNFTEQEKGIVIGEHCYSKGIDDNRMFDKIYKDFNTQVDDFQK